MLKQMNPLIPKYAIKPLALALLVNSCVYMGIAQLRRFLTFSSLETPLDTALPFLAPFVLFYVLAFVQWGLNYLLIARDSKELCYRFAFGNIIAKIICLFFFLLLPTTLARPEVTGTDLCSRLVRLIYTSDPPVNLFPSIHCLESWCCIRASFLLKKSNRAYQTATLIMSLGVFASTLFIKQHVIADVFGGIVVFEGGFWLAGRIQKAIRQ
ncbi:MAG: phosphatidic acid phosphatase [Roseburia sp.]|nr:phosphatidic acid phosphatase [Roseburia sp.]